MSIRTKMHHPARPRASAGHGLLFAGKGRPSPCASCRRSPWPPCRGGRDWAALSSGRGQAGGPNLVQQMVADTQECWRPGHHDQQRGFISTASAQESEESSTRGGGILKGAFNCLHACLLPCANMAPGPSSRSPR